MRAFVCGIVALAALCGVHARPMAPGDKYPQVIGVKILDESLREHKTDLYRLDGGFVVRRGDKFTLEVITSLPLDDNEVVQMFVDEKPGDVFPVFATKEPRPAGRNTYHVDVYTKTVDPIGKYTDVLFQIQEKDQHHKLEDYVYQYPFPVYLVFNPYHSDEVHHIGDPDLVGETLLHEWGPVFTGTIREYGPIHWYYGQFDQKAIDTAFRMLEKMPRKNATDVSLTMQFLSHNIGCANQTKPVGNWDGVLYGRWFQDFPGGVAPGTWSSTIDIIDVWKAQGEKPAKYGQCWVFAAVQQTYLRAIGIPSRQVTAFEAMIGKPADEKGVTHHVVNYFYDKNGKIVHKEGHCWNFHSWNDVYIKRKNDTYSGWNVLDGTPTGKGPGSVKAIHDIDDTQQHQVSPMIDSVHATVRWFLVECSKEIKEPTTKGQLDPSCKSKKTLKYNHEGVHVVVTKQPTPVGEKSDKMFDEYDITKHYVDPSVDAYIPEPNYPPMDVTNDASVSALTVSIIPEGYSVVVGSPIKAEVAVSLPEDYDIPAEGVMVNVGVGGDVHAYDESMVKPLEGAQQTVRLTPDQPTVVLRLEVAPEEYLVENMHDLHVQLRVVCTADEMDFASIDMVKIMLKSPPLNVRVPPLVAVQSAYANDMEVHDVHVHVSNPHDFAISNVCVDMFTPDLKMVSDRLHCVNLAARESVVVTKQFAAPEKEGRYPVTFVQYGPYMPTIRGKYDIVVADDDDRMRLSHL